jgi:hypothetical protein
MRKHVSTPPLQLVSTSGRVLLGLILVLALLAAFTGCSPNIGTPSPAAGSWIAFAAVPAHLGHKGADL